MSPFKFLIAAALGCSAIVFSLQGDETITDPVTGKSFPSQVSVSNGGTSTTLDATGVATRKKLFVKVYSIAHYMESPEKGSGDAVYEQILSAKKPKQLDIIWVRNVGNDKVQGGYREALDQNVGKDSGLQSEIDQFIGFFGNPVNNGDKHLLTWLPDGTLEVSINGTSVGTIKNENFAKAVWSIWFGQNSVVNRENLVSLLK